MKNNKIFIEKILSDFKNSDFYKEGMKLDTTKPRVIYLNYMKDGRQLEDVFPLEVDMSVQEMHFEDHFDEPIDILTDSVAGIIKNMSNEQFNDVYMNVLDQTKSKILQYWKCLLGTNPSDQEIRELTLEKYMEISFIKYLKDSNEELIKLSYKDFFDHPGYNI